VLGFRTTCAGLPRRPLGGPAGGLRQARFSRRRW